VITLGDRMNKVWFITGAGSGIGAATARAARKAGHRVVATGRNLEKLREALAEVAGDDLLLEQLDVTSEAEAKRAVDAAVARFGRIDVLVNNAGYSLLGNFEEFTTEQIERQFAPNFWGVVHMMRAVLPIMRRQRSGHIINISSVAGVVGQGAVAAYGASKFAVEGLSLAVAHEVERFGIKVTVVEPGFFRTGLLDPSSVEWSSEHIEDYGPAGNIAAAWSVYDGQQPNDPAALGEALVQIADMEHPPKVFAAGGDALDAITPVVEARLAELRAHADLSKAAGGTLTPAGSAS
jgi:NAD(P)-dependent dehydrogenase (short-subunit alcohol dehydrogenase family)